MSPASSSAAEYGVDNSLLLESLDALGGDGRGIHSAAPERCVWGSDWPHTPAHDTHKSGEIAAAYRALSYETLVDDFIAALPSAKLADAIMRDNAVRLYGF